MRSDLLLKIIVSKMLRLFKTSVITIIYFFIQFITFKIANKELEYLIEEHISFNYPGFSLKISQIIYPYRYAN